MALETTVIGSYPKPSFLQVPDWFKEVTGACGYVPEAFHEYQLKIKTNGR